MSGEKEGERRLGAVMFTDIVGYSALASADERRALMLLEKHREVLRPVIKKHGGVEIKTIGDAFLVEFPSAVEAVECAVEMQKSIGGFAQGQETHDGVKIRIGIHVGDIVHRGGDVLGDAVNVAARVEPLAEPGGVCVTRQVVDQVQRKVGYRMESMGIRELKNIGYPVEVYKLGMEAQGETRSSTLDRHRLAVLPFANMSSDPNDRYFADGMTEEIISTVSKIGELQVISRTSVMRYRDTTVPISQIGRELSVGSILEGSVRKAGNKVRITAQLIQAQDDRHLWSQSYDRDLTDVFAIQGDIAEQVASSLKVHLVEGEKKEIRKRATTSPEAYTLYLKGRYYWNERSQEGIKKAVRYFEEAVKLDPAFALAHTGMADSYSIMSDYGWMVPKEAGRLAKEEATKALELDDSLAEAHASLGLVLTNYWWELSEGERELRRAIELKPNYAPAYHWLSIDLFYMKRLEEAFEADRRALELDPHSRIVNLAVANYNVLIGNREEGWRRLDKIIEDFPDFGAARFWRSAWLRRQKEFDRALEEAREYASLDNGSWSSRLNLAWIQASAGLKGEAEEVLAKAKEASKSEFIPPSNLASIEFELGREETAFDYLDRTFEEKDTGIFYFNSLSTSEGYKKGPRWNKILAQLQSLGVKADSFPA
ncbi:MAG TPA: adenylate/guanylate cyclase domain-containing protein [Nitrososphaerales archaeon]|nr:adenylate/guanylate cyclase domain-containing protein [Nitrososphaerales archaeon]